jgi:hypothetical protein
MKDRSTRQPHLSESTRADKAARSDRLAAEMRKNLMKRKQQQRQKSETAADPGDAALETKGHSDASDDHR